MLVIRRKPGESIVIGDNIEVQVTEITPNRVKLCVAAPKEISVLRKEVHLTREANRAAADAIQRISQFAAHLNQKHSNEINSQGPPAGSDMNHQELIHRVSEIKENPSPTRCREVSHRT